MRRSGANRVGRPIDHSGRRAGIRMRSPARQFLQGTCYVTIRRSVRSSRPARALTAVWTRRADARLDLFALLSIPLVLALLWLILFPLVTTVLRTFTSPAGIDIAPIQALLADPSFGKAFVDTGVIVLVAGAAALLLGALFAWLNERTDASLGVVSTMAPLVPLLMPPVAMAVGWMFLGEPTAGFLNGAIRGLLGMVGIQMSTGPLDVYSWPGMIFLYTIALVPFAYVVISPAFRNMDIALEEAARMSGAGLTRTMWTVSLPLIGPALMSAALLIVIIGAAMYSIPAIIGVDARIDTLSVYIVNLTQTSSTGMPRAVASALVLVLCISAVWLVQRWIVQRQRQGTISGRTARGTVVHLGPWRRLGQAITLLYLVLVAVLPLLALVVVALQPYWQATIDPSSFTLQPLIQFFTSPTDRLPRDSLITSLELGLIGATLVMFAAAILTTYAQNSSPRIGNLIRGITKVPAAISGLVIAVAVLFTFAGPPFELKGSFLILLLAYLVMFMPQASIAAEAARGQVGDDLLEASSMLGGSRLRTVLRILWPLMRPGLVYGWAMIFVLILGDLIAAAILAGPGNQVVGSAIVAIFTGGVFSDLAVLGMIVTFTALLVVGLAVTVFSRRPGQRGRRRQPPAPTIVS
jgi:iron(III) transport system permease protein